MDKPQVVNAPGLVWRKRKNGWAAEWHARTDLVERGYVRKYRLIGEIREPITAIQTLYIQELCRDLQDAMLVWAHGSIPILGTFDGTMSSLIRCYHTDPDSPIHKLRYRTRQHYVSLTRRIDQDYGTRRLEVIGGRDLHHWYQSWIENGHIAMGHGLIRMARTLFSFGSTILGDAECERLSSVMHKMRFKMAKPRNEILTAEQAIAIRRIAHQQGLHSIAMAQAFQFDLMLRQKDVIGEWVPISEPGTSDVVSGNNKWLRGIRWSEIDKNLILRHTTSKRDKDIQVDLHLAPMVMEEFARFTSIPTSGPVIVQETTETPYATSEFRRIWRKVADASGLPRSVRNMDSRAGAITEATDAGAELEHVRHAATHGDVSTTTRYSRGSIDKTAKVMEIRLKHRNRDKA